MIDISDLAKSYGAGSHGAVRAVDRISFAVRPGRVTALLGPNGAGKTTTLRILLGLARPDAGTATINGRRYQELDQPTRTVGALLEWDTYHPARSGRVHLKALAALARLPRSRVDEALDHVELTAAADRRVRTYSQGMRRRLGLAAALLGDPAVFVADEPQGGLDPQGTRWLRDLLRRLAGEGRTVLVSSHLLAEVSRIADDVVILDRGRLVDQGPVAELVGDGEPGARLEELFLARTHGLAGEGGAA